MQWRRSDRFPLVVANETEFPFQRVRASGGGRCHRHVEADVELWGVGQFQPADDRHVVFFIPAELSAKQGVRLQAATLWCFYEQSSKIIEASLVDADVHRYSGSGDRFRRELAFNDDAPRDSGHNQQGHQQGRKPKRAHSANSHVTPVVWGR